MIKKTLYKSIIIFVLILTIAIIYNIKNNKYYSDSKRYKEPVKLVLGKLVRKGKFISNYSVEYDYDLKNMSITAKSKSVGFYSLPIPYFSNDKSSFIYNDKWELIQHKYDDSYVQYEYNKESKIERYISNGETKWERKYITKFDSKKNIIYYKDQNHEYKYDYDGGNLVKEVQTDFNSKIKSEKEFHYLYNKKNRLERIEYTYDDHLGPFYDFFDRSWVDYPKKNKSFDGTSVITAKYKDDLLIEVIKDLNNDNEADEIIYIEYNNENLPKKIWSSKYNYQYLFFYKTVNDYIPISNQHIPESMFALDRFNLELFNAFNND